MRKVTSSEMTETFGSLQEEIAGRKQVEEALRASEERSRVLFSRASDWDLHHVSRRETDRHQ